MSTLEDINTVGKPPEEIQEHVWACHEEIRRLKGALETIVNSQPCMDGGMCFYPRHDGDGNYIGENHVDPIAVMGSMASIAQDALSNETEETRR